MTRAELERLLGIHAAHLGPAPTLDDYTRALNELAVREIAETISLVPPAQRPAALKVATQRLAAITYHKGSW